jgi:hypothetical protein
MGIQELFSKNGKRERSVGSRTVGILALLLDSINRKR